VRNITFVDSAKVSFSNPARQPLFEFEDSLEGGKPKAAAAAAALKRIFPSVVSSIRKQRRSLLIIRTSPQNAVGLDLAIPMPGHPVSSAQESATRSTVEQLEQLIQEHDAVFLLMDSRESRWLPTLLAAKENKMVINAALGFDSWLVMRHGSSDSLNEAAAVDGVQDKGRKQLGCYFCNDIVAPTDVSGGMYGELSRSITDPSASVSDRSHARPDVHCYEARYRPNSSRFSSGTSDVSCTASRWVRVVLRVAEAFLTDTLLFLLSINAPAEGSSTDVNDSETERRSPLGLVPHQLRGFLGQFKTMLIEGAAYDRCTGCSRKVRYCPFFGGP
jgi:ubiquitin-like modifier-activating enzyme ATG7